MHVDWKSEIRRDLSRICRTKKFAEKYLKLQSRTPALEPYPSVEALLGMLRSTELKAMSVCAA